ncbi:MAG TPA: hypothetical protein V6D06_02630 [Trichocoleus sp.]
MNSAASHSPDFSKSPTDPSAESASLKTPPKRPTLVSPPQRPTRPTPSEKPAEQAKPAVAAKVSEAEPKPESSSPEPAPEDTAASRYQPIAPPSEPMQYRAIGLIRGTYAPEDEQFNRGTLTTEDGVAIEAVLLGRVTSLVKKHLNLETPHLWVVYPRTRKTDIEEEDQDLHVQIVGVWEPETLGLPGEGVENEETDGESSAEATAKAAAEESTEGVAVSAGSEVEAEPTPATQPKISLEDLPPVDENYFSIRGEIVQYEEDQQVIIVKILQGLKRPPASRKAFRLMVQGTLEGRTVGYFWELHVKREAKMLVLDYGKAVGIVPPRKRKGGGGGGGRRSGPPRRGGPGGGKRPFPPRAGAKGRPPGPSRSSEATPTPIPKPKTADS